MNDELNKAVSFFVYLAAYKYIFYGVKIYLNLKGNGDRNDNITL